MKKRSLFYSLMNMSVYIVIFSFVIVFAFSFSFIGRYIINERRALLESNIEQISDLTSMLIESNNDIRFQSLYQVSLETISNSTNSNIIILNNEGELFFRTKTHGIELNSQELSNNSYVKNILSGKKITDIGTLGGALHSEAMSVGSPIYYNSKIAGAVLMFVATPSLTMVKNSIMGLMLIASLISAGLCLVLSYFLSKRISKPLKEMNNASKKVAAGNYGTHVTDYDRDKITEISELIDTFNSMSDSIENAEQSRRDFVSNLSHELRTPMTSISGFIEGILDGTISSDRQEQYLTISLNEIRRLSRLVTEMVDLSRIENSVLKLNMLEFDINECIRQQIIRFESKINEKHINVDVTFLYEECICLCDKDAITRVIINLLDNAVKFCNIGGTIKIDVTTDVNNAVISIENSGEGIESDDLKHVFDKFYKTDKSRSLDKKGVGLGLYIAKSIIRQHEQTIKAESEIGKYTKFTFTLPLA